MDFALVTVGQVQNVLSAMQKNLECPICLDVVQEPVSTKCDHIFCRFCMFKLISKKKKGVAECPLCKTEVTKRSLKENSRFKQLIEGLLETIRAFELDTGVKILKSHCFPKTSTEATAAESLCKERSVIQSKGFRNRRKSAKGNEQENFTLQEDNVNIQLTDAKMCRPRNKPQKCHSQKGVYIEFGSESSEEFFKEASKTGFEDKGAVQISSQVTLEELESAEKGNGDSCNAQPDKLSARETTLPNVIGESDFSKEGLSKKSTRSITECAKPDQMNVAESQNSPLNSLAVGLLPEQCDRTGGASPTVDGDTALFKNTEEMDEQQTQYSSANQELDSEDNSESRLERKEMDTDVQSVEAVEAYEPDNDSSHDKELPLEKLPQPETLHSATLKKVSKKRLKQSIWKVNEWFSKSNEILSSSSSLDESAASAYVSGEGDLCLSDKESCISEKTDPMADSMEIAAVEGKKRWSKQGAENIKDKIFGKTYRRERKSDPFSTLRDILPPTRKEDMAADKCLSNFSKDRLKRKRKTACALQPEDFIQKKDTEKADGGPKSVNCCLGDAEKKRCDESVAVNESHLSQDKANNTLAELEEEGESTWKKATEKVSGEPEMYNCDQKSTKKRSSAAKRCKRSTRPMCALQLVVDRNSGFPDPAEPQIESYPSSGEPRKADGEQNQVRCSRRLQLLSEEMTKETRKGLKGARKSNSDHGRSVSREQRNVAAHSAEGKDLCEPQDMLSSKPVTNLEGGDLEANEMQVSPKNFSDTAKTGKSLFNPLPSCQPSNYGSTAPDTDSQDSEIQGSPLLLHPSSVSAGQTASHRTEEMTESATPAFSQEGGHNSQSVPGDFKTEKLPMAKNVLELTKEAEDSELDTQYLRNIFRHSKRSSFSLFQAPRQAHAGEDPASETLYLSCAAQVENKDSKQLQPESLQEEKTAAQSLSRVSEKEKLKICESAHVDPVPCFAVSTGEHRGDISQAAEEGTLTPVTTGIAQTEHNNGLIQEEQGNEKPVSTEIGIESELGQNRIKSSRNQSDQRNTEKHDSRQTDVNTGQEISLTSENNQVGKTEVVDCEGPVLHSQSRSMIGPAACQQSPAEFSCEATRTKAGKRERKHVKGNEEQAAQTVSTAVPECSAAEALEEPFRGNLTGLSETPDGLLCSDTDIENTSFCETDRKEHSAVFVKSGSALGKELHNRNVSSKPRSQGIRRSRRRVQKLPSSDEESCEDEDLPCFQKLIFGKSASTPLQTDKQMTSVVESQVIECPVSPRMLPHSVSNDEDTVQKVPEAALSNVCASPSQESECSVNLFSSQSNVSEESLNGAQELKEHLPQAHVSKQMSSVNDSKETSQNGSGGLKGTKDECQEDPDMGANLGEASGYDSEISIVEDSCGPFSQGEILTTQQKNAMQKSLKKLEQEMAALEAVLKQNGSQNSELLPVQRELPHPSTEGTFEMDQNGEEKSRSPELLLPSSKSSLTKRSDLKKGPECDSVLQNEASSEKTKPVQEAVQEHRQCQLEAENAEEQKSGTRHNSASLSSDLFGNVTQNPDNSSSSVRLFTPQTAEATPGRGIAQNTDKSCGPGHKLEGSECFPVPVLHNATGKENATSSAVTRRKEMSIVASGLNHSEHVVVQKFVKKTQSTLSNHITEGTTHVIMKTDKELVCERTLKYFLGIAGGKWVVSYQWVIQSFKEGRILDEENFEVRGDVINGRNHQGPKRARQALTEKIFKDFEICCCGPFTDMTTEHLEWMVELCGASVVKQPDLFTHTANSTAVVVVQPDAWKENVDYRAIPQQSNVAVVTREWVLDSVACYECQELSAYLMS